MLHEVASSRKKWADYESDSEDGNDNGEEVPDIKAETDEVDEDFDDDKDSEVDLLDLSKVATASTSGKKSKPRNLSKKERMELRQKELNDLDSILAEYKQDQVVEKEGDFEIQQSSNVDDANGENEEQKNKRKKKKKHPKAGNSAVAEEEAPTTQDIVEEPSLVDIGSVLKAREKKKSTAKVDPLKIALEEAMKNSSNKKKKRDKSKFSEGSY